MGTNASVREGCAKSEARNNARVAPIYMVGAPSRRYSIRLSMVTPGKVSLVTNFIELVCFSFVRGFQIFIIPSFQ